MDLSSYTLPDLRQLLTKIEAEIELRTDTTQPVSSDQKQEMAPKQDLTLDAVLEAPARLIESKPAATKSSPPPAAKTDKPPSEIKYRNPAKPEQGWSGRGRRPQWVLDWLAQGKPIEDLAT